ncbi:MAG: bifunctional heptose 7-phosphate kinase/heptose 1-phosphate adenyltransferase [Candidatus Aminicenantia bacterium]
MKKEITDLFEIIDRFTNKKIAVWGDYVLDEYVYTFSSRLSREAPVLILKYQNKTYSLGGAGNSVKNIKSLGGSPLPIGVIGQDVSGEKNLELLTEAGIDTNYLIQTNHYSTPTKTRILAGGEHTRKQQVLRIDKEEKLGDEEKIKSEILSNLIKNIEKIDALLISDYNYYTVKEDIYYKILPRLKKLAKPITLDSRFRILNFKEVTIATPNEPEVNHALKIEINDNPKLLEQAGVTILEKIASPALLITRGYKGMTLFEKGKKPFYIPIYGSDEIIDVTGAGDTVISTFTLALASGASFKQAALLSNYAGSIVVMKKGAASLTQKELKEILAKDIKN